MEHRIGRRERERDWEKCRKNGKRQLNKRSERNLARWEGDSPSAVSLTFCCCRFRCRDKSHKETRRVTNQRRSSEASTLPSRTAVYNMMSSVEGEWEEREKEGEVITAPFRLPRLRITSPKFVLWHGHTRGNGHGWSLVGWWVGFGRRWCTALRFRLPSSSGGEQQLRRRRWQ